MMVAKVSFYKSRKYKNKNPDKILLYHKENGGVSSAEI